MGDISTEPSMEDILSSIKRIIAEEGDAMTGARSRRAPRVAPAPAREIRAEEILAEEILELSEPAPEPPVQKEAQPAPRPAVAAPAPAAAPVEEEGEPILSRAAAAATRGPLEALSRMMVKPEVQGSDTLEGLVREMLRPMLSEWLDANLPQIVEAMVAREIARITQEG